MTKHLTVDEMISVALELGLPGVDLAVEIIEQVGTDLARDIAAKVDVCFDGANYEEPAFAGTCATFWAKQPGQPCPTPLDWYDQDEWTDEDGNDCPEQHNTSSGDRIMTSQKTYLVRIDVWAEVSAEDASSALDVGHEIAGEIANEASNGALSHLIYETGCNHAHQETKQEITS